MKELLKLSLLSSYEAKIVYFFKGIFERRIAEVSKIYEKNF